MRPISVSDGHDFPWLGDELVPSVAAMVDNIVVGFEDAIGWPFVAEELPDVLDRIELGRAQRQGEDGDICGYVELARGMPPGLIHDQDGMGDEARYLLEMEPMANPHPFAIFNQKMPIQESPT